MEDGLAFSSEGDGKPKFGGIAVSDHIEVESGNTMHVVKSQPSAGAAATTPRTEHFWGLTGFRV